MKLNETVRMETEGYDRQTDTATERQTLRQRDRHCDRQTL